MELTLDNDVVAGLKEEEARTGRSLQQLANDFLRHSLNKLRLSKPKRPFIVRARHLGMHAGLKYNCAGGLIEQLEGPFHR